MLLRPDRQHQYKYQVALLDQCMEVSWIHRNPCCFLLPRTGFLLCCDSYHCPTLLCTANVLLFVFQRSHMSQSRNQEKSIRMHKGISSNSARTSNLRTNVAMRISSFTQESSLQTLLASNSSTLLAMLSTVVDVSQWGNVQNFELKKESIVLVVGTNLILIYLIMPLTWNRRQNRCLKFS